MVAFTWIGNDDAGKRSIGVLFGDTWCRVLDFNTEAIGKWRETRTQTSWKVGHINQQGKGRTEKKRYTGDEKKEQLLARKETN